MLRLYDTPIGVATRTQRDAPMPTIRRWAAHDPPAVHHGRGRGAGPRGPSRQRAGVAAHRDAGRLFAADTDDGLHVTTACYYGCDYFICKIRF